MGSLSATPTTITQQHPSHNPKNHNQQHSKSSPHPMLSQCCTYTQSGRKYLMSEWLFVSKQRYDSWQTGYSKYLRDNFGAGKYDEIKEPVFNFLFMPVEHLYSQINYCSSQGAVKMKYEMVQESLATDILHRSNTNQPYTQQELSTILAILVNTSTYLHQRRTFIGHIHPASILIDSGGSLKITTQHSWLQHNNNLHSLSSNQDVIIQSFHLSEQLLMRGISRDGFQIGISIAQCILLEDLSHIYVNGKQKWVDEQRLRQIVERLLSVSYYPLKLMIVVIGMIQLDVSLRFSCHEVLRWLEGEREGFIKYFGCKYNVIKQILLEHRKSNKYKLFTNGELSISYDHSRINGISTVQMIKRTDHDTFNISFLDITTSDPPSHHKASHYNRSWANADNKHPLVQLNKRSNVSDDYYGKAVKMISGEKHMSHAECARQQQSLIAESDVRQIRGSKMKQVQWGRLAGEQNKRRKGIEMGNDQVRNGQADTNTHHQNVVCKCSNQDQPQELPFTTHNSQQDTPCHLYCSPELRIYESIQDTFHFSFHELNHHGRATPPRSAHKSKMHTASSKLVSPLAESIILKNGICGGESSYTSYEYSNTKSSRKVMENVGMVMVNGECGYGNGEW